MEGRQHAVLAKACLLKGEVALGLGDLTRNRNQRTRVIERGAVERRELAQQLAGAQRIGARKRRNGVERIEMRINLSLQCAHLGASRKLLLQLELVDGKLRRQDLGKAGGQSVLGAVDSARRAIVELERADGTVAYLNRCDDAGGDLVVRAVRTHHVDHAIERLHDTVFDHVARGERMDGCIGQELFLKLARTGQHVFLVGNCHRHGARLRQNATAHQQRRLLRQAALDVLEHGRGHRERLLGVLRAHRIGIKRQIDKNAQKDAEQSTGDNRRNGFDSGRQCKDEVGHHADGTEHGNDAEERN